MLKSTLLQLDSTFSEREYGASTFRDFVQRLARAGYLTLKGTDRNIYVELKEGADGVGAAAGGTGAASGAGSAAGAGTGLAAAGAGSGAGQGALPAGKDAVDGDAADAGDSRADQRDRRRLRRAAAASGAALQGDVAGSGAGVDADGLTASGGSGSLGEAAVDQGPGANGSTGANEAYASGVTDGDDTDTVRRPRRRRRRACGSGCGMAIARPRADARKRAALTPDAAHAGGRIRSERPAPAAARRPSTRRRRARPAARRWRRPA